MKTSPSPSPPGRSVQVRGQTVPLRDPGSSRARVLFLSMHHLGWKTWCQNLERHTPDCAELEAIHFHVQQPFWMKLANRPLPRPVGRALLTPATAWRWHLRRHFQRLILAGEFDAIFVNSQIFLPGLIAPCRASGTRLMACTDVTGPAYVRDLLGQDATGRSWEEERAIFAACSLCVPMSDWIADSLAADFGVPRERILVLPPVIDLPSPPVAPRDGGTLRLLFCGNDWKRKGGPRLLEWHQRHWTALAELHIVSNDAEVPPNLPGVVHHGRVPNERLLKEILPLADVFCLPTWQDMSPFAVTEAQAFGLPTVTSRIGGMANLVLDGQTGFLVPPADEEGFVAAVTRLLRDADLRAGMRQAAREHARQGLDAGIMLPRLLTRIVEAARQPVLPS